MAIFSKLLDISGFFLIVVINLSLIALLCYYAKKKFESLEEIQREQSKVLFDLVSKSTNNSSIDPMFLSVPTNNLSLSPNNEMQELSKNKIITLSEDFNNDINVCLNDSEDTLEGDEDSSENNNTEESEEDEQEESEEEDEEEEDDEEEDEEEEDEEDEDDEEQEQEQEEEQEVNHEENEINLEKMTISELKSYIESKGEKLNSKKTKKSDILEYIKTNNL